jgi:hypothetical protein
VTRKVTPRPLSWTFRVFQWVKLAITTARPNGTVILSEEPRVAATEDKKLTSMVHAVDFLRRSAYLSRWERSTRRLSCDFTTAYMRVG